MEINWKMKIGQVYVAYNVHTQRTPVKYRATLHRATRTTLASLLLGCYSCLLCFLRPLITRRGLLATSWRRSFDLLVGKLSPRSTQCTPLHRSLISIFSSKIAKLFSRLNNWISDFFHCLRRILHFSANCWWIFFRISRQIPEKSDVCRFSINFAKTN